MQAPGHKLNTREQNPNPYITFIRVLKQKKDWEEIAEHMLKAVAAQMKRIFKDGYMNVGTLEEAPYNRVFAGRNWNYGQTIELVLRRPDGRFLPMEYIISVMCHEMAHITYMNHGRDFQKRMAAIKKDVAAMRAKGDYGDGFWSNGNRLRDSQRMGAEGLSSSDFPEYMCGITASDARKGGSGRGRATSSRGPGLVKGEASLRSGRQTAYRRKAGSRNNVDMGDDIGRLDGRKIITKEDKEKRAEWIDRRSEALVRSGLSIKTSRARAGKEFAEKNPSWTAGSTRGKKAASKTAADLRAAAAEKRMNSIKDESEGEDQILPSDECESEEGGEDLKPDLGGLDLVDPRQDAEDRRRELEEDMSDGELENLRGGWEEYVSSIPSSSKRVVRSPSRVSPVKRERSPFRFTSPSKGKLGSAERPVELDSDSDDSFSPTKRARVTASRPVRKETAEGAASLERLKAAVRKPPSSSPAKSSTAANSSSSAANSSTVSEDHVRQARLRSLGMSATTSTSTSRRLGDIGDSGGASGSGGGRQRGGSSNAGTASTSRPPDSEPAGSHTMDRIISKASAAAGKAWACTRCTLENEPGQENICGACGAKPGTASL